MNSVEILEKARDYLAANPLHWVQGRLREPYFLRRAVLKGDVRYDADGPAIDYDVEVVQIDRVCSLGALDRECRTALLEDSPGSVAYCFRRDRWEYRPGVEARAALLRVAEKHGYASVEAWNDDPARRLGEVLDGFAEAIASECERLGIPVPLSEEAVTIPDTVPEDLVEEEPVLA